MNSQTVFQSNMQLQIQASNAEIHSRISRFIKCRITEYMGDLFSTSMSALSPKHLYKRILTRIN